jgi:hypothetical protein
MKTSIALAALFISSHCFAGVLTDGMKECGDKADKKEMLAAVNHKTEAEQTTALDNEMQNCMKGVLLLTKLENLHLQRINDDMDCQSKFSDTTKMVACVMANAVEEEKRKNEISEQISALN